MRIAFEGLPVTIEVPEAPEFHDVLRAAAPAWPYRRVERDDEPVARVRKAGTSYEIASPWEDGSFVEATAVSAVCSVVVDLITSYIEANPRRLCLHCGAAVLGGHLVVFPSRSRAGKSTLMTRLAAAGYEIFGDDVLPLDDTDTHGIALGLAPRPRVPLPRSATPAFRQFVKHHSGPGDDRYLYLDLGERLPLRGASAPLGAIVLLDRRPAGPAALGPAPRSETLKALITQNFARSEPADALLDRLHRLTNRLPCLALTYSDLDGAAELLERTFSLWPLDATLMQAVRSPLAADAAESETRMVASREGAARQSAVSSQSKWRSHPDVRLCLVEGEAFLASSDGSAIYHLNPVGAGLWNLLSDGIRHDEAIEVLLGAFPGIDPHAIACDVDALVDALASRGLIVTDGETHPADTSIETS